MIWRAVLLVMVALLAADQFFLDGRGFDAVMATARVIRHHFRF
jgi:hypothetical protein